MTKNIDTSRKITMDFATLALMLRLALGYGSRESRIAALLRCPGAVSFYASQLRYAGLLGKDTCKLSAAAPEAE